MRFIDQTQSQCWLVDGFNPSEKYESVGMIIPNIWKKMFQTTNQLVNIPKHPKTLKEMGGFQIMGGYPKSWMVYNEKSDNKTDDLGVPP